MYFSGTGNSKYVAKRIADALGDALVNLNDRIKVSDTSLVETGERVIIVTPTYAWRIPRVVRDWLLKTELHGAKNVWFIMTCGSEIGNADKYNRELCTENWKPTFRTITVLRRTILGWTHRGLPYFVMRATGSGSRWSWKCRGRSWGFREQRSSISSISSAIRF